MSRRTAVVVALVAVTLPAGAALAAWTASSIGSGSSKARSLPAASGNPTAAPTPATNSGTVRVTFSTATFSGATLSYAVNRYAAATGGSSLATTICSTSPCDIAVSDGTWYFGVAPALQNWRGTATTTRALAVVDTTAPLVTIGATLPGSHTVKLSGSAGTASGDAATVSLVVCKTNTFPCSSGNQEASQTLTVSGGAWTWTSGNLGNKDHYAQVTQTDSAGNTGAAASGKFTT